jgi:hypothetical protein
LADLPKDILLGSPLRGKRFEHLGERHLRPLHSVQDRLDDVRLEQRQAQDAGHVGRRDPLALGQFGNGKGLPRSKRASQRLDWRVVRTAGLRGAVRVAAPVALVYALCWERDREVRCGRAMYFSLPSVPSSSGLARAQLTMTTSLIRRLSVSERLPTDLSLNPNSVTVSGLSSGGFFAHQFHIAFQKR